MSVLKKIICVIAAFLLLLTAVGCDSEEYSASIYADIGGKVSTLDPQLADSAVDRTVVLNLFSGLMRLDDQGNAVLGAAESFERDGNTYTFTLKEGLKWNDGSALTAEDFAFGLFRAADKLTNAPDYDSVSCISGADALHEGKSSSLSGVSAIDERTLKITLSRDDRDFLKSLAKPIAMPCDKEFFQNAKGKYGRDKQNVLSNGAYYLRSWNTEDFSIRLQRNEHYSGERPIPANVYFSAHDEAERTVLLNKNSLDLAFVPCDVSSSLNDNVAVNKYYNRCWYIFINRDGSLGNETIRRALSTAIHRSHLENEMPEYLRPLSIAMPQTATLDGQNIFDGLLVANSQSYNPDEAYTLYESAADSISGAAPVIIYPTDGKIESVIGEVAAGWQQTLACFINMSAYESDSGVASTVKNGIYTVAVSSIPANSTDAYEYLCNFKSGNPYNFSNSEFDRLVDSLPTLSGEAYINTVIAAEKLLLADASIIPLCISSTDLAYSTSLSGAEYNINGGYIDFSKIKKK